MGKIHKEGIWLLYELLQNAMLNRFYCNFFACQAKKKSFLWRIVIADEK